MKNHLIKNALWKLLFLTLTVVTIVAFLPGVKVEGSTSFEIKSLYDDVYERSSSLYDVIDNDSPIREGPGRKYDIVEYAREGDVVRGTVKTNEINHQWLALDNGSYLFMDHVKRHVHNFINVKAPCSDGSYKYCLCGMMVLNNESAVDLTDFAEYLLKGSCYKGDATMDMLIASDVFKEAVSLVSPFGATIAALMTARDLGCDAYFGLFEDHRKLVMLVFDGTAAVSGVIDVGTQFGLLPNSRQLDETNRLFDSISHTGTSLDFIEKYVNLDYYYPEDGLQRFNISNEDKNEICRVLPRVRMEGTGIRETSEEVEPVTGYNDKSWTLMTVTGTTNFLAIRTEAEYNDSNIIGRLYNGDKVLMLSSARQGDYVWVYSDMLDIEGFVNKNYLK